MTDPIQRRIPPRRPLYVPSNPAPAARGADVATGPTGQRVLLPLQRRDGGQAERAGIMFGATVGGQQEATLPVGWMMITSMDEQFQDVIDADGTIRLMVWTPPDRRRPPELLGAPASGGVGHYRRR